MKRFLKRLFCLHNFEFGRNIYGDEIISWGWKRSLWRCTKCGKIEARDDLVHNSVETGLTRQGA